MLPPEPSPLPSAHPLKVAHAIPADPVPVKQGHKTAVPKTKPSLLVGSLQDGSVFSDPARTPTNREPPLESRKRRRTKSPSLELGGEKRGNLRIVIPEGSSKPAAKRPRPDTPYPPRVTPYYETDDLEPAPMPKFKKAHEPAPAPYEDDSDEPAGLGPGSPPIPDPREMSPEFEEYEPTDEEVALRWAVTHAPLRIREDIVITVAKPTTPEAQYFRATQVWRRSKAVKADDLEIYDPDKPIIEYMEPDDVEQHFPHALLHSKKGKGRVRAFGPPLIRASTREDRLRLYSTWNSIKGTLIHVHHDYLRPRYKYPLPDPENDPPADDHDAPPPPRRPSSPPEEIISEGAMIVANMDPATGNLLGWKISQCTICPEGGYPSINGDNPGWWLNGIPPDQEKLWDTLPGCKAIIQIAGYSSQDGQFRESAKNNLGKALALVHRLTDTNDALISPGTTEADPPHANAAPHSILVYNMSGWERDQLQWRPCCSTPEITIFIHPFSKYDIGHTYLGNLGGFSGQKVETVLRVFRDKITNSADIAATLDAMITGQAASLYAPGPINVDDVIRQVAHSLIADVLRVKDSDGFEAPEFCLYLSLPDVRPEAFSSFRNAFAKLKFSDPLIGNGCFIPPTESTCGICHGADHPRGMCPYPTIPGWHGPKHQPERPALDVGNSRPARSGPSRSDWRRPKRGNNRR
ncbi:hypothetical protein EIP86_003895 [Pleurotus ostreatoroseus]|nr:hypothetical protein EIP86_003895 [Pleurotus ostreatoroseus]